MGNAESDIRFPENIGQIDSMAAMMSGNGNIPIKSLNPLVGVLRNIERSIQNVEKMCSRLDVEIAEIKDQQVITDRRVALLGFSLQEALKAGLLQMPAGNTEEPEQHTEAKGQGKKEKAGEEEEEEAESEEVEEEKVKEADAQNKRSKKKSRRGRAQTTPDAAAEPEPNSSLKTDDDANKIDEFTKMLRPISPSGQSLFEAAGDGQIADLRALLDAGVDPNTLGTQGAGTALHRAASRGHLTCVSLLLKRGAHPDIQEILGRTPLHLASLHGHIECMKELMKHGASMTSREISGQVPLHYAAIGGFVPAVKEILKQGADIDVIDSYGTTPLKSAVTYKKLGTIKALLDAGAKKTDPNGVHMLSIASTGEVKQILKNYK